MSYRKIVVNDENYQYSIGKSHIHIKGENDFSITVTKEQYAKKTFVDCGCGDGHDCTEVRVEFEVTPAIIKNIIIHEKFK